MLALSRFFFSLLYCLPLFCQASMSTFSSSSPWERLFLYEHLGAWARANQLLEKEKDPRLLCKKVVYLLKNNRYYQAVRLWKEIEDKLDPKELLYRQTLRELCWEKLREGFSKGNLETQRICLLAAAMQADIDSIPFLTQALQAPNQLIRKMALTFSANFYDEALWAAIYKWALNTPYLDEVHTLLQSVQRQGAGRHLPFLKQLLALEFFPLETRLWILQQLKELMKEDFSSLAPYFHKLGPTDPLVPYFNLLALPTFPEKSEALIDQWRSFDHRQKQLFLQMRLRDPDFCPDRHFIKELSAFRKGELGLAVDRFLIVKTQDVQAENRLLQALEDPLLSKALLACSYLKECGPLLKESLVQRLSQVQDSYVSLNIIHYLLMFATPSEDKASFYEPLSKKLQALLLQSHFAPVFHLYPLAIFPTFVPYGTEASLGIEDKTQSVQEVYLHMIHQWAVWDLESCKLVFEKLLKELSFKHLQMVFYLSFSQQLYQGEALPLELLEQLPISSEFESKLLWVALKKSPSHKQSLKEAYPTYQDRDKAKVLEVLSLSAGEESWGFLADELFANEGFLSYLAAASLLKALAR